MSYDPSWFSFIGFCMILGSICILISFFTWPLVAIFITRRFDPIYKPLFKGAMGLGRFLRGGWYATAMSNRWLRRKGSTNDWIFKDNDLWHQATVFERWIAAVYTYSGMLALLMAIIFGVGRAIFWIRHSLF